MDGKLFVIDGIDGSGKTTLAKNIKKRLGNQIVVIETFEKRTITNELERVAAMLGKTKKETFSDRMINIAWMLDLIINVKNEIMQYLLKGENVILVRYILSAKVYSLATTGDDMSELFDIYSILPMPVKGILVNISSDLAETRVVNRGEKIAFYECAEYLKKIQKNYKELKSLEPYPIAELNGDMAEEEMVNYALEYFNII